MTHDRPKSCFSRALVSAMAALLAACEGPVAELDRDGAIDVAKRQVKNRCSSETSCTFTAKREKDKWYVRVDFPKRPQDKRAGHSIWVVDQNGRIVGRVQGG